MGIREILATTNNLREEILEESLLPDISSTSETRIIEKPIRPSSLAEVRDKFVSAKTEDEIYYHAQEMSFKDWLSYLIKMSPKDVNVKQDIRQCVVFLPERGRIQKPDQETF